MSNITLDNLEDFIRGTAILGTGGGGDPYIGRLMLEQELHKCGEIRLIAPQDVPDDLFGISLACMGAPTAFVEKLPNASAMIASMRRAEKELGREFNAIVPAGSRRYQRDDPAGGRRQAGAAGGRRRRHGPGFPGVPDDHLQHLRRRRESLRHVGRFRQHGAADDR